MDYDCFGAPFEFKFLEDGEGKTVGAFEGYGAVFGNMDSHGDVIEPGAFANSLLNLRRDGRPLPPMYKQHGMFTGNPHEPIGVWDEMEEDTHGLRVKGKLIGLDTEQGKWNYAQMRDGALRGLSIGFTLPPGGYKRGSDKAGEPKRYLKAINLREVSIVDAPSNARAFIREMKARAIAEMPAQRIKTIRDFENYLREEGGYSHAEAKGLASRGFKAKAEPRDEDAAEIRTALRGAFSDLAKIFSPK